MNATGPTQLSGPPDILIEPIVRAALLEDLGRVGDITSSAIVSAEATMTAMIAARQPGVVAGIATARLAFRLMDPTIAFVASVAEGEAVEGGTAVARIEGNARAILAAERVALNFLSHLSGIATATAALCNEVRRHGRAQIVCTRKTTPGLRTLEKHAVRAGGGANHRFGLDDAILIKDNHIAVAGSVTSALQRARASAGHLVKIEIEVDTLDQLDEAMAVGVDAVLLDNMDIETLREAVRRVDGRAVTEASGRMTTATIGAVAASGVDLISVGWITHSAPIIDLGLDVVADRA
jgi:nicotinate-nucleotide pyrophosphorylase (carboxylating)